MTNSTTTIPTIDISPYLDGTDKIGVAQQINHACTTIGFFLVKGHGIPLSLLEKVQHESSNFFQFPLSKKQETMAPFGLGYMGEGMENAGASLNEDSKVKDIKESLNLTLPVRNDIWPNHETLRNACKEYYTCVERLAGQLMRLFALALELQEDFFDAKVDDAYTTLRLLNYPAVSVSSNTNTVPSSNLDTVIRTAEHTDYGTLTVLWSSDSRGLQAQSRQGQWIDVVSQKSEFIINIGDLMMNWTNDKWISTLHRVVVHPDTVGKGRMSIPFFHNPNPNAVIECIPGCYGDENPKKYEAVLAKKHLERKVSQALGKVVTLG